MGRKNTDIEIISKDRYISETFEKRQENILKIIAKHIQAMLDEDKECYNEK